MKDISVDELAAISPEIHEAATRLGCTHASVTGRIWPGGQLGGAAEEAARFVEFSWYKAAVVNGQTFFEDADPHAYASLLHRYGLGDELPDTPPQIIPPVAEPIATLDQPFANLELELLRTKLNEVILALRERKPVLQPRSGGHIE